MKLNSSGLFGLIFPFDYISRSHPPRIMRSNLFTDLPYPLYIGHPSDSEVVCSADLRFGSRPKSVWGSRDASQSEGRGDTVTYQAWGVGSGICLGQEARILDQKPIQAEQKVYCLDTYWYEKSFGLEPAIRKIFWIGTCDMCEEKAHLCLDIVFPVFSWSRAPTIWPSCGSTRTCVESALSYLGSVLQLGGICYEKKVVERSRTYNYRVFDLATGWGSLRLHMQTCIRPISFAVAITKQLWLAPGSFQISRRLWRAFQRPAWPWCFTLVAH